MEIKEALAQLDAFDDDQWTADGLPKLDVVSGMVGERVTRQQVTDAAPQFNRENMETDDAEEEGLREEEGEVTSDNLTEYLSGEPMQQRQFAHFLSKVSKEELTAFEAVLNDQLEELEERRAKTEDLYQRVKVSRSLVRNRIRVDMPDMSNQEAIRAYISRSHQVKSEKAEVSRDLLSKIDINALDPRAPIDRAFARKLQRGTKRPER